jgi:hypothetical protein
MLICAIRTLNKGEAYSQDTNPSERMLHKDYDCKGSVKKISGREPQAAWRQDGLIGGKPPAVK